MVTRIGRSIPLPLSLSLGAKLRLLTVGGVAEELLDSLEQMLEPLPELPLLLWGKEQDRLRWTSGKLLHEVLQLPHQLIQRGQLGEVLQQAKELALEHLYLLLQLLDTLARLHKLLL
jgi:hypothetical protein